MSLTSVADVMLLEIGYYHFILKWINQEKTALRHLIIQHITCHAYPALLHWNLYLQYLLYFRPPCFLCLSELNLGFKATDLAWIKRWWFSWPSVLRFCLAWIWFTLQCTLVRARLMPYAVACHTDTYAYTIYMYKSRWRNAVLRGEAGLRLKRSLQDFWQRKFTS